MKRAFFLLALLAAPVAALEITRGEPFMLSWDLPTEREDGTALPISEIRHYAIRWGCDTGIEGGRTVPPTQKNLVMGSAELLGRCKFDISTTDTDGQTSKPSPKVSVFIKLPKPAQGGFR